MTPPKAHGLNQPTPRPLGPIGFLRIGFLRIGFRGIGFWGILRRGMRPLPGVAMVLLAAALLFAAGLTGGCIQDAHRADYPYNNPLDPTQPSTPSPASGSVVIASMDPLNEVVVIVNTSTTIYTLTNWTLASNTATYTFPAVTLLGGQFVRVQTSAVGTNFSPKAQDLYWAVVTDNWSNTADTAVLKDSTGSIAATCTYTSSSSIHC